MLKKIKALMQRFSDWREIGALTAELEQIKYWRDYAERRAPRIRARLIELGEPVDRGLQNAEQCRRAPLVANPPLRGDPNKEKHHVSVEHRYRDLFVVRGEAQATEDFGTTSGGQWKGRV